MARSRMLSKEEREARREAEREQVRQAVAALQLSAGWQGWLRVRKHFRRYSALNQLLIAAQMPHATHVAGFRAWLNMGYCVRKGEKAIRIFAPVPPSKKAIAEWQANGAVPAEKPKTRFRLTAVFDRSQVDPLPDGDPVDLDATQPAAVDLLGDDLAWAWPLLVDFAGDELQVPIALENLAVGGPDGYFTLKAPSRIAVAERLSPNGRVATAVHELAHALVRRERDEVQAGLAYAAEELLVETVAHIVCGSLGLDVSAASIPYLASWSAEAKIETIEHTAKTIDAIASRIEAALLTDDGEPITEMVADRA